MINTFNPNTPTIGKPIRNSPPLRGQEVGLFIKTTAIKQLMINTLNPNPKQSANPFAILLFGRSQEVGLNLFSDMSFITPPLLSILPLVKSSP